MRTRLRAAASAATATLFLALACTATATAATSTGAASDAATAARSQVIVRFAPTADRARATAAVGARAARASGVPGFTVVDVPANRTRAEVLADLRARPDVLSAEPDTLMRAAAAAPSDPGFARQWALRNTGQDLHGEAVTPGSDVDALAAWDLTPALGSITVAVVDTGVQAQHPDLAAAVLPGYDATTDPAPEDAGWIDHNGHGTHVAGIIAASAGDQGIAGLARGVKILPVRVLNRWGTGTGSAVAAGFAWAADHGAKIVNASLGGELPWILADVIAEHPDVLFVFAAGNDGHRIAEGDVCMLPMTNVMCVTATDGHDALPEWANQGAPIVDLAAPGVDISSDYVHERVTPLDLDHASAWTLAPGWTVGGGVLRYEAHGTVTGDEYDIRRDASPAAPVTVPAGQPCDLVYDVKARVAVYGETHGGWLTPWDSYTMGFDANVTDGTVVKSIRQSVSADATWDVRPRFTAERVSGSTADDLVEIRNLRLACAQDGAPGPNETEDLSGTSMAAPMVSATAALTLAAAPGSRPEDLAAKIRCGVDPITGLGGMTTLSGGRLNARGAIQAQLLPRDTAQIGTISTALNPAQPVALATAPDGALIFTDLDDHGVDSGDNQTGSVLRRLAPDGTLTTIAGPGTSGDEDSTGPAAGRSIGNPGSVAVSPDGSIWFSSFTRIRRIDPQGVIHTVFDRAYAPTGPSLTAEPDGSVLFAGDAPGGSGWNSLIRRLDRNGNVTIVAGGGTVDHPDGVAATDARFGLIVSIVRAPDGALLIGHRSEDFGVVTDHRWSEISRIGADGKVRPWLRSRPGIATGPEGATPDEAWVDVSQFTLWNGAAVVADGRSLWSLAPGGHLTHLAGRFGTWAWNQPDDPPGTLATDGRFSQIAATAVAGDGGLWIADTRGQRLRKISAQQTTVLQPYARCGGVAPGGGGGPSDPATGSGAASGSGGPADGGAADASAARPSAAPARGASAPARVTLTATAARLSRGSRGTLRLALRLKGTTGARIAFACRGGCPRALPKAITLRTAARALTLSGLRPGATVTLRATLRGATGRYITYKVTQRRQLARTTGCLSAGGRATRC